MRRVGALLAPALLTVLVAALPGRPLPVRSRPSEPAAGMLLIADRGLTDPNFAESVVLLTHYGAEGATGIIVNRPTEVAVARALPQVERLTEREGVVWQGGPVRPETLTALVRSAEPPEDGLALGEEIHLLPDVASLDAFLATEPPAGSVRIYHGVAGWAPGQLDAEIARGGWHLRPARARWVFSEEPEGVWALLIRLAFLPTV